MIDYPDSPRTTDDMAPPFSLPDASGANHELTGALADGPLLLVFYRGDW